MNRLPKHIRKLCSQLAAEQNKRLIWGAGKRMRRDMVQRLQAGESVADIKAYLHREMVMAIASQHFDMESVSD